MQLHSSRRIFYRAKIKQICKFIDCVMLNNVSSRMAYRGSVGTLPPFSSSVLRFTFQRLHRGKMSSASGDENEIALNEPGKKIILLKEIAFNVS